MGDWEFKCCCRKQLSSGKLCGKALSKGFLYCNKHKKNEKNEKEFNYWDADVCNKVSNNVDSTVEFVIIASDGLWDFLDHGEAGELVTKFIERGGEREDVAKYLVDCALKNAVYNKQNEICKMMNKKRGYVCVEEFLESVPLGDGGKREIIDDTTCVVVFLNVEKEGNRKRKVRK